jgi:hypothetical protein
LVYKVGTCESENVVHAEAIEKGTANARLALAAGDSVVAALILDELTEAIDQSLRDVIS